MDCHPLLVRQRVKISNARISWEALAKDVPQESIIGPLLFNISIKDMFYFIEKCTLHKGAEDKSLSISAPIAEKSYQMSYIPLRYHQAGLGRIAWLQTQTPYTAENTKR